MNDSGSGTFWPVWEGGGVNSWEHIEPTSLWSFLTLEDKIRIYASPCNILYILYITDKFWNVASILLRLLNTKHIQQNRFHLKNYSWIKDNSSRYCFFFSCHLKQVVPLKSMTHSKWIIECFSFPSMVKSTWKSTPPYPKFIWTHWWDGLSLLHHDLFAISRKQELITTEKT